MSRLPKAPLIEVIFELRWSITNTSDLAKFNYLHGDLYSLIKKDYPHREHLVPPDTPAALLLNNPIYRFRNEVNGYPLVQLGPGLLTVNTTDAKYFWQDYFQWCKSLISSFCEVYKPSNDEMFHTNLIYYDLFVFDLQKNDVIAFINENLNINLRQSFLETSRHPSKVAIGFNYETEYGQLDITLDTGKSMEEKGLVLKTQLTGPHTQLGSDTIPLWLDEAHTFCSNLFKQMIHGNLYESFK